MLREWSYLGNVDDGDDSGWSRSEWARWWLEHDEVDEAARVLEPGDVLSSIGKADFHDLAAALARRGLTALYEDQSAFVYTPAQADEVLAEIAREVAARESLPREARERRPPMRAFGGLFAKTPPPAKKTA